MNRNSRRAAAGLCLATAIVAGGVAAPAAQADTTSGTGSSSSGGLLGGLGDVLNGVGAGLGTIVGGVTSGLGDILGGGGATPTPTASSSTTTTTTADPLGGVTSGVGDILGGVAGGAQQIVDGVVGGASSTIGQPITVPTTVPTTLPTDLPTTVPTDLPTTPPSDVPTSVPTDVPTSTTTPTQQATPDTTAGGASTAPTVTGVTVTPSLATVYPAKDGYRDSVVLAVRGATSDGTVQVVTGTASLTYGSTTVATWPVTSTNQDITWNGWIGSSIKPGKYVLTAVLQDTAGTTVRGAGELTVSSQKLVAGSTTVSSKAVSGTHPLTAKAKAGLAKGEVQLKLKTKARGITGKQYLVLTHGSKRLRIRILNGTHTSKAVTVPSSFTTYRVSHTWKKGVKLSSVKYVYTFKTLK